MTTRWIGDDSTPYSLGETGFLVEHSHQLRGSDSLTLREHPTHTNQSHQPRLYGWCGTTNDIAIYARGVWRVTKIAKNGRAMIEQLKGPDLTAALETLGYPALAEEVE